MTSVRPLAVSAKNAPAKLKMQIPCHVFMGYLLVFSEAVIKTLHWEYEENHCVVQKHHTFMKEEDDLICV